MKKEKYCRYEVRKKKSVYTFILEKLKWIQYTGKLELITKLKVYRLPYTCITSTAVYKSHIEN